jgi:hypothetical protein
VNISQSRKPIRFAVVGIDHRHIYELSSVRLNVEQIQLVSVGGQVDCRVVALQGA